MFNGYPSVCSIVQRALQVACAAALLATAMPAGFAAIPISTSTPYTQNFDGMGTSATATLPTDFRADKPTTVRTVGNFSAALTTTSLVGGANLATGAINGIYNFGSGTTTTGSDRAVGFLSSLSGTQSGNLYAQLINNTGAPLTGLQLSFTIEKYRMGINLAGFRIQLFYSFDGATWISAGDSFQTSFPADGGTLNSGFTPAPGTTVTVSNQNLSVAIPDGSNFYLAWNYSVASGTTTSNAQALAIDDISILGLSNTSNPTATNPTATGAANPNTVQAGNSTLLTVTVTPGANPVSTGLAVTADLSSIGGSPAQQFFDDGTHGDLTPGDNVFSFQATVVASTAAGAKGLPVSITDAQSRSAAASISLNVTPPPTPPAGVTAATPSTVQAGNSTLLSVAVTPGANPVSTGLAVRADLSSIGGSAAQQFFDDGTHGDLTPGDNVFSFQATVAASTAAGAKGLPVSITDAQSRSGTGAISVNVTPPSTAPTGLPAANPSSLSTGASALLTVTVTPGTNPASTGIGVSADLTAIGGSPAQQFFDDGTHGDIAAGDNIFSFAATVGAATVPGTKTLPVTVSDGQSRSSLTAISLTVQSPSMPSAVKISQAYGGGGNSGSTYKNDFIELFNQATTPIDVSTWSVQLAPAGQSTWSVTPLCASAPCVIEPGRYFLVQEFQGAGGTTSLPTPDAIGTINLGSGSGQVALVSNTTVLTGICPTGVAIVDFLEYGGSGCPNPTSGLSNTTAAIRKGNGCIDTDNNRSDFLIDGPIPRNSSAPANGCSSNPATISGLGTASPDSVQVTAMSLLTATVTPAMTPPSTNLVVTADLSSLGGSANQQFFDDGTHGDQTAGDNTFSMLTTIGAAIPTGQKYLVAHVTDAQGRSADLPITVSVQSPTCGVEYWNVKTGTDGEALAINLNNVISTTISDLRAIPMPFPPLGNRPTINNAATRVAPTEFTVFQIYGTLTQYKLETDVDYHLVLQDENNNTIIGEVPSPACVGAQSPFLTGVMNSRAKVDARLSPTSGFKDANLPIQVTGVGFFDNIHGQTGVAPNGIELHAILDLNFTSPSATLLMPDSNPAQSGQTFTFTATVNNGGVSTPTGNVTFRDGTSTLAVVPLDASGRAAFTTSTLTTGPHTITAFYGGDSKSAPSTSAPLVETVN